MRFLRGGGGGVKTTPDLDLTTTDPQYRFLHFISAVAEYFYLPGVLGAVVVNTDVAAEGLAQVNAPKTGPKKITLTADTSTPKYF